MIESLYCLYKRWRLFWKFSHLTIDLSALQTATFLNLLNLAGSKFSIFFPVLHLVLVSPVFPNFCLSSTVLQKFLVFMILSSVSHSFPFSMTLILFHWFYKLIVSFHIVNLYALLFLFNSHFTFHMNSLKTPTGLDVILAETIVLYRCILTDI